MSVRCPTCETVYRVDPARVPVTGTRARCGVCAGVIPVSANGGAAILPAPVATATAQPSAPAPAPAPAVMADAAPAPLAPKTPTRRMTAPFFQPRRSEAAGAAPAPAPAPAPAAPVRPSAPVFKPTPGAPVTRPVPPPAPAPRPTPAAGGFVNPFLAQDPRQKARRLARALVSDMIVYQPEKRQEALASGNVKAAFEEEIKKSWEEYVDQIGEEIAKSTPYWTEALNEILAGGQQIF